MVEVYNMIISHSVNWSKTCLNISNRLSRFAWKKDLVDCLNLHERQIQYKLTGHRLDVEELYIFASLLDCSIEDLLVFDHDDFVEPERVETNKQTEMPLATVIEIGNTIDFNARHKRNCEIQNLAEFLLYLPLMPHHALQDIVSRCDGNLSSFDRHYLFRQMNALYKAIPASPAKEYADTYRDAVLRVKGDGNLQYTPNEYAEHCYWLSRSLFVGDITDEKYRNLVEGLKEVFEQ